MTDTALNIEHLDPASTEGLADLFDDSGTRTHPAATCAESIAGPSQFDFGTAPLYSAAEAAKFLSITKRSVIRLISEQKLTAIKENGKYLIPETALHERKLKTKSDGPETEVLGPSLCEIETDIPPSRNVSRVEAVALEIHDPVTESRFYEDRILKDLEAASYRVGYLEAQMAEQERLIEQQRSQIRLLTDSQYKATWWQRFKQLFVKQ